MPTKVVVTTNVSERFGGAENALWTFLGHVDRERFEPVVVFFGDGPFVDEVRAVEVRTCVLPESRLRQAHRALAGVAALVRVLRREQPDVVVNWFTKAQLYGGTAALLAGMRHRNTWWQWDLHERGMVDRLATALPSRDIATCSRAVLTAQRARAPQRRCRVILPGIDPPPRLPAVEVAARKQALSIPGDRLVVGIVGRLRPWKGQDRLVEALSLLRAAGHDVHGLVVGGSVGLDHVPKYEEVVRRRVAELALDEDIAFTGHTHDATSYMQLMDVCVNASSGEPFGIVILEALALGVPVVAVDAGGPRDIIESGVTGVLAPSSDPRQLAAVTGPLLRDGDMRARLSDAGRERFARWFTAQRMVDDIEAWLEHLAPTPSRRRPGVARTDMTSPAA